MLGWAIVVNASGTVSPLHQVGSVWWSAGHTRGALSQEHTTTAAGMGWLP